jgi:hypothetical protein
MKPSTFALRFQSRLLQNALLGFRVQVCIPLAGNGNAAMLYGMLVLPVTTSGFDSIPSIGFDELDDFSDFYPSSLCVRAVPGQREGPFQIPSTVNKPE